MEGILGRLADTAARRRWLVLSLWLALLLAGAWFSLHQTDHLSGGGWEVPGSQSVRAGDLLERFPTFRGVRMAVFVESPSSVRTRAALVRAERTLGRYPSIRPAPRPAVFEEGRAALLPIRFLGNDHDAIDFATTLRRAIVSDEGGARTRVIGTPAIWSNFQEVSKHQLAVGEGLGFPLTLVILLAAFGTVVAALAPLLLGFVAVLLTGAVIYALSQVTEVSIYVTNMASMIGIGVAVDYSLFVVSRYRRLLAEEHDPREALRGAMASSGTAVVFSGATVVVSLASLFLIDVNALRSMAAGAIIVVSIAVLASVTLLPALLAVTGRRIERLRVGIPGRRVATHDVWLWWTAKVMRRPGTALALGAALMLMLAVPLLWLHTENHGLSQLPKGAEVRKATEEAGRLAGPGLLGPIHALTNDPRVARRLAAQARGLPGVMRVGRPVAAADGSEYLVEIVPASDPDSGAARALYRRASGLAASDAAARGAEVALGGATAFSLDIEPALVGGLWKIVLFLLRSVLLPLKAVFMNLLSVGAAYGVLVAVFQWGWLDWTGYHSPGYLETIVPALVLAVTFGLSMDYEVFLLTRIRERYAAGAPNDRAVAEGLAASARVITAAALVMVAVFAAFAIAGAPSLKELGVGLAVAILLDASIVRLVIVPATMRLLGEWNWWMPGPLARVLPPAREAAAH